ncbi:1509_t:CDS:2, partial [Cetraspora pellucida]
MSNEVFEQRFIANENKTNTVFELSLDIIRDYEKKIQDLEKQNQYLSERNQILEKSNDDFVNLYTNACYHFGVSCDVFYENNVDYQHFEREVVNFETEKVEENGEENSEQYISDGYDETYNDVFKKERQEYSENYSFYNNDNFDYDEKRVNLI